ncbi:MAG: peptidylprolyl isomerase, partial [Chloroflexota bacterium]|nr:peptidylprolyl isomerase [Chloroflexota bacterium]
MIFSTILILIVSSACSSEDGDSIESSKTTSIKPEQSSTKSLKPKQYSSPPEISIDPNKKYSATFTMAGGKTFVAELFAKEALKTVNNFVFLAREGF